MKILGVLSAEQLPLVWLGCDSRVFRDVADRIPVTQDRGSIACVVDENVVLGEPSLVFQLLDVLVFFVLFWFAVESDSSTHTSSHGREDDKRFYAKYLRYEEINNEARLEQGTIETRKSYTSTG